MFHSRYPHHTGYFLLAALLMVAPSSRSLDEYVGRYDLYTGFSDLNTPGLNNINQIGFHLQAGINANRCSSFGFDYSTQNGATHLTPGIATPALRQQLAAELTPSYVLNLPVDVTIQTFTAGGQLVYRRYPAVTLFVRPVLAAFHIRGTPHATDPIGALVAQQLAPQGYLTDWYGAYGAGGGAEFHVACNSTPGGTTPSPTFSPTATGRIACR